METKSQRGVVRVAMVPVRWELRTGSISRSGGLGGVVVAVLRVGWGRWDANEVGVGFDRYESFWH